MNLDQSWIIAWRKINPNHLTENERDFATNENHRNYITHAIYLNILMKNKNKSTRIAVV